MNTEKNKFLFVGNAPHLNRGNEAIVRGTMAILRREFGDELSVTNFSFGPSDVVEEQAGTESDTAISHRSMGLDYRKAPINWLLRKFYKKTGIYFGGMVPAIKKSDLANAVCALEVGGDMYSLDYGLPTNLMLVDEHLRRNKVPTFIWGASIGPFDKNPEFEKRIIEHLKKINGIFLRVTKSYEYLLSHGLNDNLHLIADPAFAMSPEEPKEVPEVLGKGESVVGLNLSPLMARYVTNGDYDAWRKIGSEIVEQAVQRFDYNFLLIPHVYSDSAPERRDDSLLLRKIHEQLKEKTKEKVSLLNQRYNAAETKWIISKCHAFSGSRTHSTIAALSCCVPTLSLAYSAKALGLNTDLFGTLDYCIPSKDLSPEMFCERFGLLLDNHEKLKSRLESNIPAYKEKAFEAGRILKKALR